MSWYYPEKNALIDKAKNGWSFTNIVSVIKSNIDNAIAIMTNIEPIKSPYNLYILIPIKSQQYKKYILIQLHIIYIIVYINNIIVIN